MFQVTCRCKYECRLLTSEQKELLFLQFYQLSAEEQGSYILNRMELVKIGRRRHGTYTDPSESRRQATLQYIVPTCSGVRQVCSATFKSIFAISSRRLQTIQTKKKMGCAAYRDERGKNPQSHAHKRKYSEDDRSLVKQHINSFPREESHYGRTKTRKEYLSSDLNVSRLYLAFKGLYPDSNITQKYYRQVFIKDFPNISFRRPRTDTCQVCDRLSIKIKADAPDRQTVSRELQIHQRKAQKAVKLLGDGMNESQLPLSEMCTVSMDLQQVMFVPTLTHSSMFYARQLSTYNFCVHVGDNNDSFMCVWHEGIAGRGGNEISSCFLKVMSSEVVTKKKSLTVWCDNCSGQNKNRMMVMTIIYLLAKGIFKSVEMKFLVTGHSYMPCDRDFGVIEKRKRLCKAMIPAEIEDIVRSSKLSKPFKVVSMQRNDFFDIAKEADKFLNTTKMEISKASWIRFMIEDSNKLVVKCKQTFSELETWKITPVLRKGTTFMDLVALDKLTPLTAPTKITAEKKKDLLAMLEYLDPKYHQFYKDLCR